MSLPFPVVLFLTGASSQYFHAVKFLNSFHLLRWFRAGGNFSSGFVPFAGDKYFSSFKTYLWGHVEIGTEWDLND